MLGDDHLLEDHRGFIDISRLVDANITEPSKNVISGMTEVN
jgi:hypothetical protein